MKVKTKKNKEKDYFLLGFFIICSSFVLMLILLIIFQSKSHFNITKGVCHNETDTNFQYTLTYRTIDQEASIEDKRTDTEKFVDIFIPLNNDKIRLKTESTICDGYVDNTLPQGSIESTLYSTEKITDDGSGFPNKNIITGYLLCLTSNFQFKEICVDEICKDVSFNKTDCDSSMRLINGSKKISLDYKKTTCFNIQLNPKKVCEQQEVDEIEIINIVYGIKELQREIFLENNLSFLVVLKTKEDMQYIDIVKDKSFYKEIYCLERDDNNMTILIYDGKPDMENCYFENFNITSYDEIISVDKISKSEITQEWLDENCECIVPICAFGYKEFTIESFSEKEQVCYTQSMIDCIQRHSTGVCSGKNKINSCSQYKCFDNYQVEVSR